MNKKEGYLVFLVDDNKVFLTSLKNSLKERFGALLKISEYHTAEECIQNMEELPDIVFLDYYLNAGGHPDAMNGIKAMGEIKSISKNSMVIILSGQDKLQVAIDAIKFGAYDYLSKSETVFLRIQNTVVNAMEYIKSKRMTKKHDNRNIGMAIFIVSIILIDVLWYTLH
jgi:two-component system, OmpR family, response regulator